MEWVRGEIIGRGSFSTVNLATPAKASSKTQPLMAVKSCLQSQSCMLQNEKDILTRLADSPRIVRCLGDDTSFENGNQLYNLLLELASGGDLAEVVKNCGGKMKEAHVGDCAKQILDGLSYIHSRGYVHCDIKLQNILVSSGSDIKISDFGLAKKVGEKNTRFVMNGTPLYMSPESVSHNEQETPCDIWALGCVVLEMITGRPAWRCGVDSDVGNLLFRIGFSQELPEIPQEISEQGKDFLKRCLVRDPRNRWTAEMLLNHPFVTQDTASLPEFDKQYPTQSPTSAFEFPNFSQAENEDLDRRSSDFASLEDRIRQLAIAKQQQTWSDADDWIVLRE